jgi:hypothetical protein
MEGGQSIEPCKQSCTSQRMPGESISSGIACSEEEK